MVTLAKLRRAFQHLFNHELIVMKKISGLWTISISQYL